MHPASSVTATLYVATYDMPRHLALVCAALEKQSRRDFEVAFCDDGSGAETKIVIEDFRVRFPGSVRHFWQPHAGFRKCKILNQALRETSRPVCIFLDGDCVPHRHFIRDHLAEQTPGRYLAGRRVELGRDISDALTLEKIRAGFFDYPGTEILRSAWRGQTEFLNRTLRVPIPFLRRWFRMEKIEDLKGCNYSVARADLEAINGFDEAYEGYGREDTDVELRLQNLGLRIKSLKGLALQFHVWHPRRVFTPKNDDLLNEVLNHRRIRCEKGLNAETG
jgi:glycosyltransferase involved in cell wall biosynthesis